VIIKDELGFVMCQGNFGDMFGLLYDLINCKSTGCEGLSDNVYVRVRKGIIG